MRTKVIFGSSALENKPMPINDGIIHFPGKTMSGIDYFDLNEEVLSKHVLLLGGSGCGKTNAFNFAIRDLRNSMTDDDVAIIFDTKGEFYEDFAAPGDFLIGNSAKHRTISSTWNIFDEILADGWDEININMNARELSGALFHDRGSSTQPFFCNAARDIFRGVLIHFIRIAKTNPAYVERLNNKELLRVLHSFTSDDYLRIFNHYDDMRSMISYFGSDESNQGLGVFGELNSMISDYFVGILAEHNPANSISMRKAVREKGGRAIFVEYDLAVGETLSPVYRLLIDQALKEALSNGTLSEKESKSKSMHRVFFIADEFKLLPKLQHIDDALNFGRGLGVRVMAGIQSIDQLYDIYGKEKGAVIASGFGSIFAFHTNDDSSRDYISKRFGPNLISYEYCDLHSNNISSREREGKTVEAWDQMNLGLGQAVIGLGYNDPFLFQFNEYKEY